MCYNITKLIFIVYVSRDEYSLLFTEGRSGCPLGEATAVGFLRNTLNCCGRTADREPLMSIIDEKATTGSFLIRHVTNGVR